MPPSRSPKWERIAASQAVLKTEEAERADWLRHGRPEVHWTGEGAGHKIEVVETDADSTGKRRKRRVKLPAFGFPELTAQQAQDLGEALTEAAAIARDKRGVPH